MKANEFLIENPQNPNFYAIGDSVAYNIAMSGAPWKSVAQMGTTSSSPSLTHAIDSIPKGSVVAISVGADEANGMNPNINQIVQSINSLMFRATTRGLKPVFVLFPSSVVKNQEVASGLRQGILNTLGNTSLVLDMQTGTGAVANYTTIANQIISKFSVLDGSSISQKYNKSVPPATGLNFKKNVDPRINPELADKIKKIFAEYGQNLPIESGYRDPIRNKKAKGAKNSAHMRHNAVDIDTRSLSHQERLRLIKIASANGIGGIGVYTNNLHFDIEKRRAWGHNFSHTSIPGWASATIAAHLSGQLGSSSNLA